MRGFALVVATMAFALPAGGATKIALEGEASPGGNGDFVSFDAAGHLTEVGTIVFFATTDATPPAGATTAGCIFRYAVDGGAGTALLCKGDAVALPGGDFWVEVGDELEVNGVGDLTFVGTYRDTLSVDHVGFFHLSSVGVLTALPFIESAALNDANDILSDGLDIAITSPAGAVTTVLLEDQELPDETGNFAADSWATLGPDGQVAIGVRATPVPSGPPFTDWIVYVWDSGVFTRLGTNTFGPFAASGIDAIFPLYTPGGRLLVSITSDGFTTEGVAEWTGSAWVPVILEQPGEILLSLGTRFETAGSSLFSGQALRDGVIEPWCNVLGTGPGIRAPLLQVGDPLGGGNVTSVSRASLSKARWSVSATTDAAGTPSGIYVGRAAKVPSLGALGAALLSSVVVSLGIARAARA